MTISFEKAPLKEIIVDLRWGASRIPRELPLNQPISLPPASFLVDSAHEHLFMNLGEELSKMGYGRSERLTPAGFPSLPTQSVYRYQSNSEELKSVLFQAGLGQFSAHGVLPYKSWEEFLPRVRNGLEALLKVYLETFGEQPFSQVTLRYIDFFEEELVQGRDVATFMSEVLSISVQLPDFLTAIVTEKRTKDMVVKFSMPVAAGMLTITIADGKFNNRAGILLDTLVSQSGAIAPTVDIIVEVLNASYATLHHMFLSLTKPIHELMEPKGALPG
jgi:uncharacterized protein (TIGR04255 family)